MSSRSKTTSTVASVPEALHELREALRRQELECHRMLGDVDRALKLNVHGKPWSTVIQDEPIHRKTRDLFRQLSEVSGRLTQSLVVELHENEELSLRSVAEIFDVTPQRIWNVLGRIARQQQRS